MNKLQMAHEMALAMAADGNVPNENIVAISWQYADAMQAEADKRSKAEAAKQSAEVHDLIGKAHFHYCQNGACVHCGKSEKTIDDEMWRRVEEARVVDQEEWQPDWSKAPDDATAWEYLGHGAARWHTTTKGMYRAADLFGYSGTDMLLMERPHGF